MTLRKAAAEALFLDPGIASAYLSSRKPPGPPLCTQAWSCFSQIPFWDTSSRPGASAFVEAAEEPSGACPDQGGEEGIPDYVTSLSLLKETGAESPSCRHGSPCEQRGAFSFAGPQNCAQPALVLQAEERQ